MLYGHAPFFILAWATSKRACSIIGFSRHVIASGHVTKGETVLSMREALFARVLTFRFFFLLFCVCVVQTLGPSLYDWRNLFWYETPTPCLFLSSSLLIGIGRNSKLVHKSTSLRTSALTYFFVSRMSAVFLRDPSYIVYAEKRI